jgi:hypothetical protein
MCVRVSLQQQSSVRQQGFGVCQECDNFLSAKGCLVCPLKTRVDFLLQKINVLEGNLADVKARAAADLADAEARAAAAEGLLVCCADEFVPAVVRMEHRPKDNGGLMHYECIRACACTRGRCLCIHIQRRRTEEEAAMKEMFKDETDEVKLMRMKMLLGMVMKKWFTR